MKRFRSNSLKRDTTKACLKFDFEYKKEKLNMNKYVKKRNYSQIEIDEIGRLNKLYELNDFMTIKNVQDGLFSFNF